VGKIKYPNFDYYKINRPQTYIYYRKSSSLSNDANLFRKKKKKKKKKKTSPRISVFGDFIEYYRDFIEGVNV